MTALVTADLHFDDNPRNEYRWELFPWLKTQITKTGAKHLLMLGDITDAKDRHSSILVNRLINELYKLASIAEVVVMMGNHDYIDENHPFLEFSRLLDGQIKFITKPGYMDIDDGTKKVGRSSKACLFLPSTRNWREEWKGIDFKKDNSVRPSKLSYIFTHATFDGAKAENGIALEGIPPSLFADTQAQVISGDIHVPQNISRNICYVGSPYRVHFGDHYRPRVLLLRHGELVDLHFPSKSREMIDAQSLEDIEGLNFESGTQVKIRVKLKRSEMAEWGTMRKEIAALALARGWELCGLELSQAALDPAERASEANLKGRKPDDILKEFAKQKKLDKPTVAMGLEFLK